MNLRRIKIIIVSVVCVLGSVFVTTHTSFFNNSPTAKNAQQQRERAHVAYVIDGDTVVLRDGRRVRYIGIDAPETGTGYTHTKECYAQEATARNRALVGGRDVTLERDVSDVDKYGRLLRYVYVDNVFVNKALVEEGFAKARRYRPDIKYARILESAQKNARAAQRGLWGTCQKER